MGRTPLIAISDLFANLELLSDTALMSSGALILARAGSRLTFAILTELVLRTREGLPPTVTTIAALGTILIGISQALDLPGLTVVGASALVVVLVVIAVGIVTAAVATNLPLWTGLDISPHRTSLVVENTSFDTVTGFASFGTGTTRSRAVICTCGFALRFLAGCSSRTSHDEFLLFSAIIKPVDNLAHTGFCMFGVGTLCLSSVTQKLIVDLFAHCALWTRQNGPMITASTHGLRTHQNALFCALLGQRCANRGAICGGRARNNKPDTTKHPHTTKRNLA